MVGCQFGCCGSCLSCFGRNNSLCSAGNSLRTAGNSLCCAFRSRCCCRSGCACCTATYYNSATAAYASARSCNSCARSCCAAADDYAALHAGVVCSLCFSLLTVNLLLVNVSWEVSAFLRLVERTVERRDEEHEHLGAHTSEKHDVGTRQVGELEERTKNYD